MAAKKRGLGRGLDALLNTAKLNQLPDVLLANTAVSESSATAPDSTSNPFQELALNNIHTSKYQPRIDISTERLEELANSIKSQGIVQPIIVRPLADNQFEIVAGERRWRAAQLAGLDKIPALVRSIPNEAAIAIALIENIQREALNPIEEALSFQRLVDEFDLTHLEVAEAVGRSRAAVTNLLRLLALPDEVKKMLCNGDLEMGHARALLALPGRLQLDVGMSVVNKNLSVRDTEKLVRQLVDKSNQSATKIASINPDVKKLQNDLSAKLGANVAIKHRANGKGKLEIAYNSLDELDGILAHIK